MSDSPGPDHIDLVLIIPEKNWDQERLGDSNALFYQHLTDHPPQPVDVSICDKGTVQKFVLKHTNLVTIAARTPIGLVDTAMLTRFMLERFQPSIAAQIGFGGILSNDLRLGDVAIATQVDCYLTKDKAERIEKNEGQYQTNIVFAGEVFRPSHSFAQLAVNLQYAYPEIYLAFQDEAGQSPSRHELLNSPAIKEHLRSTEIVTRDASRVHAVHFACAEVVSTTKQAVRWLRARDRKLAIIDMESGGLLAAAWEYSHRHDRWLRTIVLRGAGGYGDERHDKVIKDNAEAIHRYAFETACHFLCRMLSAPHQANAVAQTLSIDVGILVPLEEEFSYFTELLLALDADITMRYLQGRFYYLFKCNGQNCAATFVADMGLVKMGLATEDLFRALSPKLVAVLGIAAGFTGPDGDVRICDVVVAREIDLYFHRSRIQLEQKASGETKLSDIVSLRTDPAIAESSDLVEFATKNRRLSAAKEIWRDDCEAELKATLEKPPFGDTLDPNKFKIALRPTAHSVRLATGEFLAASREFGDALVDRGCSAADMEAGGAAIAYRQICADRAIRPSPKLLVLRGISDRGDEQKEGLEHSLGTTLRRACMRNAGRFLMLLLEDDNFIQLLDQKGPDGSPHD
ncbi:phosphorylase family protein [Bradyrhizobium sp. URHC0002]